jgi:hypothetical protein
LRRCLNCGTRIHVEEPAESGAQEEPRATQAVVAPDIERGFTEIQRQILLASWRRNRGPIYVCGTSRSAEGEVKSGGQRFYGNDALVAIAGLVAPGLIVDVGDDCFTLTDDGARLAVRLASRPDLIRTDARCGSARPPC